MDFDPAVLTGELETPFGLLQLTFCSDSRVSARTPEGGGLTIHGVRYRAVTATLHRDAEGRWGFRDPTRSPSGVRAEHPKRRRDAGLSGAARKALLRYLPPALDAWAAEHPDLLATARRKALRLRLHDLDGRIAAMERGLADLRAERDRVEREWAASFSTGRGERPRPGGGGDASTIRHE